MNTLRYLQYILSFKCQVLYRYVCLYIQLYIYNYIHNFSSIWTQVITDVTCLPNRWYANRFLFYWTSANLLPNPDIFQLTLSVGRKLVREHHQGAHLPCVSFFFTDIASKFIPVTSRYVLKGRSHKYIQKKKKLSGVASDFAYITETL